MDEMPDEVVWAILEKMNRKADRISTALTCKRFHELEKEHRKSICLCWGWNMGSKELLLSLCKRFQNLQKVEIWKHGDCEELGDTCLYNLSISCPLLADLTINSFSDITDTGLSHLASCSNLSALKLMYAHRITGRGMSAVVVGCRKLAAIHLFACSEIVGLDWLGRVEKLEELCIRRCTAIEEGDLVKLGSSWQTLKRLHFERDFVYDQKSFDQLQFIPPCDNMLELILVNSSFLGGGLSCLLNKCRNLEKIRLNMCVGVEDSDIIALAQNSINLRTIYLQVPAGYFNQTGLTDKSLRALARNCPLLESVRINFSNYKNSLSVHGILDLVQMCPIRELTLGLARSFGNAGMQALCGANRLEMLELIDCKEIGDLGIQLAAMVPRLRVLKLTRCNRLTDNAFESFKRRRKLEVLEVHGCPSVSEEGIKGAAGSVTFSKH